MDKLKAHVESEIDRVYANKETKERQSVLYKKDDNKSLKGNADIESLRGKGSAMSLNEDLLGLDTLEVPDQTMPPTADEDQD